MSAVIILAPMVIAAAWPVVAAAASAVMVSMGYSVAQTVAETAKETIRQGNVRQTVEIEMENSAEVGSSVGREEEITFTKDDISVVFRRDVRGHLRVCVSGENHSKCELQELGQQLSGKVIQQYVYNRVVSELQQSSGMTMIEQEVDEDQTIRIKLRSWE